MMWQHLVILDGVSGSALVKVLSLQPSVYLGSAFDDWLSTGALLL
jgi:hypothetical protein